MAATLQQRGLPLGARVALMVPPGIEFVALVFALFKAGMVSILIDPGMGKRSLIRCLSDAKPVGLIGIAKANLGGCCTAENFDSADGISSLPVDFQGWSGSIQRRSIRKPINRRLSTASRLPPLSLRPAVRGHQKEFCTDIAILFNKRSTSAAILTWLPAAWTSRDFRCLRCSTPVWV